MTEIENALKNLSDETLLLTYVPEDDSVFVVGVTYEMYIGCIKLEEGPGYILDIDTPTFLDSSELTKLAEIVNKLNETLKEF